MGNGISGLIGYPVTSAPTLASFPAIRIPLLADIPIVGEALFNHHLLVYIAYFVLPIVAYRIIFRTRHGIAIRAVGDDPAAADASGISVHNIRFLYTTFAGVMFAIAGAYMTLALTKTWAEGIVAGQGWIALTLVFFSRLNPITLVFGALLFGGATSLSFIGQIQEWPINSFVLGMAPYIVTLLLILFTNIKLRRVKPDEAGTIPAFLTLPYYRE